jgi:hypothetical protein
MKFDFTSHGCAKAITYLYSIDKMSDSILRRDGWEIVGYANKLWKKNNEEGMEDMDVCSG